MLLAEVRRIGGVAGRITMTASTPIAPFFVPPKLSTSALLGELGERAAEVRRGVGEPCAVQEDAQLVGRAELAGSRAAPSSE